MREKESETEKLCNRGSKVIVKREKRDADKLGMRERDREKLCN